MSVQINKEITTVQVEIPKTNVAIETAITEITVQTSQPEIIIATAGVQGPVGPRGFDTGTSGTSGTSGVNGTSGINGSSGTSGTNGTTGTAGSSGTSGISGTNGSGGTTGSSGTSGVSGSNGTSGTSGINGTSGTSGVSGSSGTNGTSGTSGTSGVSGSDGTSGTSGTSGTTGLTAFTSLKLFAGGDAGSYTVDYGYFNYNAYGNSLAIAKTPLFNSYLDFVGTGSQNWTLKSLNPTYPSFTIDLGTPQNNNENTPPNKDIWVLPFTGVNIPQLVGVPNGNEYAFYLTKTGALGSSGTSGTSGTSAIGSSGTSGTSGVSGQTGSSGTSGVSGSSGTSGVSGSSGTSGVSGEAGSSGTSGVSGSSGTSGVSGSSGTSGVSGEAGSSGTSGLRGDSLFALTGSKWATTNTLEITGSLTISSSATFTNIGLANFIGKQTTTGSLNVTDSVNINSPEPKPLSIGDSFGGGKLAYILTPTDAGYDSTLIKGIVAATADEATPKTWTNAITASNNKVANGYDDWYLPSKDELNKLYLNKDAIGGFVSATYWSSTQSSSTNAWFQIFLTGTQTASTKTLANGVRAIRAFSIPKNALNIIGNTTITGSLNVSGGIVFSDATLQTTAFVPTTYATTSSLNLLTASLNDYTSSNDSVINRILQTTASLNSKTGSFATTGSNTFIGNQTISGSINIYSSIPPTISIGDSFQGGKVAYILQSGDGGYDETLVQGIIAAEADEPTTLSWADAYTACDNKTTNGYTDWYLPNWATLYYTLYVNRAAIGGFTSNVYWSQTQVDFMNYQGYGFGDNSSYSSPSTYTYYVRAVRNFSIPKGNALNVIGNTTLSGSVLVSGSIIPATANGTYTSSFSLGSVTNAWKDLYISHGSIIFVDALTQATTSFSIENNAGGPNTLKYTAAITASAYLGDGRQLTNLSANTNWNNTYDSYLIRNTEQLTFSGDYILENGFLLIEGGVENSIGEWINENVDGDGTITRTGNNTYRIDGPNDDNDNGWLFIKRYFDTATTMSIGYEWFSDDGNNDWPMYDVVSEDPTGEISNTNRLQDEDTSYETGTWQINVPANNWLAIGVYSNDSCCGSGSLHLTLPYLFGENVQYSSNKYFKKEGTIFIGGNLLLKDSRIENNGKISVGGEVILIGESQITGTGTII